MVDDEEETKTRKALAKKVSDDFRVILKIAAENEAQEIQREVKARSQSNTAQQIVEKKALKLVTDQLIDRVADVMEIEDNKEECCILNELKKSHV